MLPSCSAGKLVPFVATPNPGLNLEQSETFKQTLSLDANDSVISLGRLGLNRIIASTKLGNAFDIAVDTNTITKLPPLIQNADKTNVVLTSSDKYVWQFMPAEAKIGRNISGANGGQLSVSYVTIGDLDAKAAELTAIAATEDHLYLTSSTHLFVFTWESGGVARKRIELGSNALKTGETATGAGTLNSASPDQEFWLATTNRLLTFKDGIWKSQPFNTKAESGQLQFVSFYFDANSKHTPSQPMIALFSPNTIASLSATAAPASATLTAPTDDP